MTASRYKDSKFNNDKPGSNNAGELCAMHTTKITSYMVDHELGHIILSPVTMVLEKLTMLSLPI